MQVVNFCSSSLFFIVNSKSYFINCNHQLRTLTYVECVKYFILYALKKLAFVGQKIKVNANGFKTSI